MDTENTFTVKIDGVDVTFKVKKPSKTDLNKGRKVYNETFSDALLSKSPLRRVISQILQDQGLWNDEKQAEVDRLREEINAKEFALNKGGFSLSKAREMAIELRKVREQVVEMLSVHTELDSNTAEGQAEDARFNYLVSACVVYNEGDKPYFKSYEDYLENSDSDVAVQGARILATMLYSLDKDYLSKLAENAFLKENNFVDEEYRLINKEGKLISTDGRLIDENGYYLDENGKRVDKFGHPLTKDGKFDVEKKPFLDDEGNPI